MVLVSNKNLIVLCIASRVCVLFMQVIFNLLLEDHSPDVFNPPDVSLKNSSADKAVELLLGGFRRWDSIYMIHIAEHGYTYENTMAFFPVFPLMVRLVGMTILQPLHLYLTMRHVMMVAAFVVNSICFVLATHFLYQLATKLCGQGYRPWFSAALFCINPASIFMSAAYSEASFALFSFALMFYIEERSFTKATFALGLAVGTRSNGLVLMGYPMYLLFKLIVVKPYTDRFILSFCRDMLKIVSCITYGALPYMFFQYLGYSMYCKGYSLPMHSLVESYGKERKYHMPADPPNEWCFYPIPFSYGYIQQNHWDVGFLNYYTVKQIPNYLLALPVICIAAMSIYYYLLKCKHALRECVDLKAWLTSHVMLFMPYCFHLLFLIVYGIANVHIQILTRMVFSSSPLIYIYASRYLNERFVFRQDYMHHKLLLAYFAIYFTFGTALHSNFLPWT